MHNSGPTLDGQIVEIPTPDELRQLYNPRIIGTSVQVTDIIDRIVTMIRRGELAPGQRLIEADLTQAFDVVRGRVREALLILAGEGLLELVPQRGARVIRLEPGGLVHHIQALEPIVAKGMELFGQRFGVPEGRVAEALIAAYERIERASIGAPFEVNRSVMEYYALINHLSGNSRLNHLVSKLGIILYERQLGEYLASETHAYVIEPHRDLVHKVLRGESAEAVTALKLYVSALIDRIRE